MDMQGMEVYGSHAGREHLFVDILFNEHCEERGGERKLLIPVLY